MLWRKLFPLALIISLVDGFICNLLYPAKFPYLYKDIFIGLVYFLFATQENVGRWMYQLQQQIGNAAWFSAMSFMFIGVIQVFNLSAPGLVIGLLGFKLYFYYWPLALLAYAYVDDFEQLKHLIKMIVYVSVPINIFGLYQFSKGPEYMVTTFGPGFQHAVMLAQLEGNTENIESFLRILGTFASSGQYTQFLIFNIMFVFALLFSTSNIHERLIFSGVQVLNFLALLGTGTRSGIMIVTVQLIVFAVLCRRARPVIVVAFLAGFCLYISFFWLGRGVLRRYESLKQVEMIRNRTIETTQKMFVQVFRKYPLGKGLGSGSGAAHHLAGQESKSWALVENYASKLQLEAGIIGVIFFYSSLLLLLRRWYESWLNSFRFMDEKMFDFAIALSAYCFAQFMICAIFSGLDTPPASVFLWTIVGMSAKLATLGDEIKEAELNSELASEPL